MIPVSPAIVRQVVSVLKQGGVVLFPTETAYGLAADATNAKAIRRIFEIKKGRDIAQTPPLLVASFAMADRYIVWTPLLKKLARQHWPGPLTVVCLAKREPSPLTRGSCPTPLKLRRGPALPERGFAPEIIRADGTVAVRISPHPIAQALVRSLGRPLVATSANLHGQPSEWYPTCYSAKAALKQFALTGIFPDAVLDIGAIPRRKPSTLIGEKEGKIIIFRQGPIRIR